MRAWSSQDVAAGRLSQEPKERPQKETGVLWVLTELREGSEAIRRCHLSKPRDAPKSRVRLTRSLIEIGEYRGD